MECSEIFLYIMADAIKFQLNLGNGALNLAYNEVVKNWYNDNVITAAEITPLDWTVLIVYHPQAISSFILFRDAISYISGRTTGIIYSQTPSGNNVNLLEFHNYGGTPGGPGFSFDGGLILAK